MSDYTKITDYAAKDALLTGDPAKLVKGTEIGADFDAVATAIATKANLSSAQTFSGVQDFDGRVDANAGLAVTGGDFTSRGITDSATATALTISGSGANGIAITSSSGSPKISVSGASGNLILSAAASANVVEALAATTGTSTFLMSNATTGSLGYIKATNTYDVTVASMGTGSLFLATSFTKKQVVVTDTATADRWITMTGSAGGNPTIGVSAGSLSVGSSLTMLQSNLGAFAAGEWSRDANWGTYYKAPAVGLVADVGFMNNAGTAGWGVVAKGAGYTGGSGGAVVQITSRTTGVTLDKPCGRITLVSAAGSTSWQTFTVTNSFVDVADVIIVNQRDGTDLNEIHVTDVSAGAFNISFRTTGGTTVETPIFNFAVIKAHAA